VLDLSSPGLPVEIRAPVPERPVDPEGREEDGLVGKTPDEAEELPPPDVERIESVEAEEVGLN